VRPQLHTHTHTHTQARSLSLLLITIHNYELIIITYGFICDSMRMYCLINDISLIIQVPVIIKHFYWLIEGPLPDLLIKNFTSLKLSVPKLKHQQVMSLIIRC
jgi:hypothetical protein